jgi:hypothetical protein
MPNVLDTLPGENSFFSRLHNFRVQILRPDPDELEAKITANLEGPPHLRERQRGTGGLTKVVISTSVGQAMQLATGILDALAEVGKKPPREVVLRWLPSLNADS